MSDEITVTINVTDVNESPDVTATYGDFDGNGVVDISDFLLFVDVFGLSIEQEGFEARFDLDGNGVIGIPDFLLFVDNFGKIDVVEYGLDPF